MDYSIRFDCIQTVIYCTIGGSQVDEEREQQISIVLGAGGCDGNTDGGQILFGIFAIQNSSCSVSLDPLRSHILMVADYHLKVSNKLANSIMHILSKFSFVAGFTSITLETEKSWITS